MAAQKTKSGGKGRSLTYADSGVNIEAGDEVVDMIGPLLRRTHGPRVLGRHGAFAGMFRLDYNEKLFKRNYRDPVLVACTDGVGTKVKLAIAMGVHDTIGIDCVAMNVNDLIVQGAEPLLFLDYVGVSKVIPEQTTAIIRGVARGCEIAECALIGGECSEMPSVYSDGDFDLVGFAVGVVELARAVDPARMQVDDVIIGLSSSGVHSNGYSLVRRIIQQRKLRLDKVYAEVERPLGEALLEPTRIYAAPIVKLLRRYKVKRIISGMAHITGGGLPGNINRALPDTLDARIALKSWDVPAIFDFLQKRGGIDRDEMFRVFNMGIGYVLIVRPTFADSVVHQLQRFGEDARVIGKVVKGSGKVRLV